jgi:N-methyl-L-tryptophan oxidase
LKGAWAQKMLKSVGIEINFEVWRCCYAFWKFDKEHQENLQKEKFPIFIYFDKNDEYFYGFPCFEYPDRLKASMHFSNEFIDPDENNHQPSSYILNRTEDFMKKSFKGLQEQPYDKSQCDTCLYTVTEDENFIIDQHPKDKDIVIFSGGSGHAFKFGSLLGEIMSDLVEEKKTENFDIGYFSLGRFSSKDKKKGPSMLKLDDVKSKL